MKQAAFSRLPLGFFLIVLTGFSAWADEPTISSSEAGGIALQAAQLSGANEPVPQLVKTDEGAPYYIIDIVQYNERGVKSIRGTVVVDAKSGALVSERNVLTKLGLVKVSDSPEIPASEPKPKSSAKKTESSFEILAPSLGRFFGAGLLIFLGYQFLRRKKKPKIQVNPGTSPVPPGLLAPQENANNKKDSAKEDKFLESLAGPNSIEIIGPHMLPKFSDVGGMDQVKDEIRQTMGTMITKKELAKQLGVQFNGILFYGPPGTGKTLIVKATAGEYNFRMIHLKASEITSPILGAAVLKLDQVFKAAIQNRPCMVFFDEFESIAPNRKDAPFLEDTRVVTELLRWMEDIRKFYGEVVVCAATNHKENLDEAMIRSGRFDRHISIPLPDTTARKAILAALLKGKPVTEINSDEIVAKMDGMSAADMASIVNQAFLKVLNENSSLGGNEKLDYAELVGAIDGFRSTVRANVKTITWDELILQPEVKNELKRLVKIIENPDMVRKAGVEPPKGILLFGPPGTGKTTIARVIASQANASFFAIGQSEIYNKWYGESQQKVKQIFDEARQHKPSIIFIDEIDAIMRKRGASAGSEITDQIVSQILQEIDGLQNNAYVFVIGATNNPKDIDQALLRGGRLSAQIEIPLPEADERKQLFELYMKSADKAPDINFSELAEMSPAYSGADIKEICSRTILDCLPESGQSRSVYQEDLLKAMQQYKKNAATYEIPADFKKGKLGF